MFLFSFFDLQNCAWFFLHQQILSRKNKSREYTKWILFCIFVQFGGSFVLSIGLSLYKNEGGALGMQLFKKCST